MSTGSGSGSGSRASAAFWASTLPASTESESATSPSASPAERPNEPSFRPSLVASSADACRGHPERAHERKKSVQRWMRVGWGGGGGVGGICALCGGTPVHQCTNTPMHQSKATPKGPVGGQRGRGCWFKSPCPPWPLHSPAAAQPRARASLPAQSGAAWP